MSLFEPSVEECRESVRSANAKYLALSYRIGEAVKALKNDAPTLAVIAILDGATTDNGGTT